MSTNVADGWYGPDRRYTVAELVARERTKTRPARTDYAATEQTNVHVTELLQREGIEYDGPVAAPVHAPTDQRGPRGAMLGKAAVLFGLTVAGFIGLKPALSSAPAGGGGAGSGGGPLAAPQGIDPSATTVEVDQGGGGASPTTSADVALRGNTDTAAPQSRQHAAPSTGTTQTTKAPAQTSVKQAPRQLDPVTTQPDTAQPDSTQPDTDQQPTPDGGGSDGSGQQGDDQSGGLLGDVLDPVTGTVSGVLDAGDKLLGG